MICRNLFSEKSGIVDEDDEDILTCSLIHKDDFDMATDDEIRATVRRLTAMEGNVSTDEFKLRQQAVGFRHEPDSLLNDTSLDEVVRPASCFAHDWMHCLLVTGVFNTIVRFSSGFAPVANKANNGF